MKTPKPLKQRDLFGFFEPPSPSASRKSKATPPRKKRGGRRNSDEDIPSETRSGSTSSNVGGIRFEPKVIEISDSSEVEDSPKRPRATQRKTRRFRAESVEKSSGSASKATEEDEEEELIGVPVTWTGKGREVKGKRKRAVVDSDSEDSLRPRRRKLVKGVRPPTPEVDDLLEEVDEKRIIESRFRARDKKSTYLQNLEKLKKRKQKQSSSPEPYEEESDDGFAPFAGAKPHRAGDSDISESDDSDNADEDEDGGLGGFIEEDNNTTALELPTEFSMNTYQDLMHHFKIICQLFVHMAVQPVENRQSFMEQSIEDKYFSVPLQIARRKLTGMRDAIVTSSVWKPDFKKTLETYPEFETVFLDFAVPECDACHLGGRMSTITGRVSGKPYDRLTFEPLDDESSEEEEGDEDEDEDESRPKKEFNLGRFCARRTRVFHNFTHWEYALYQSLRREVEDLHNRGSKKRVYITVAYAGGMNPPEDLTDADGIMNWLDERGLVSTEWQKIKEMMNSATNLEMASKRGGDDTYD